MILWLALPIVVAFGAASPPTRAGSEPTPVIMFASPSAWRLVDAVHSQLVDLPVTLEVLGHIERGLDELRSRSPVPLPFDIPNPFR